VAWEKGVIFATYATAAIVYYVVDPAGAEAMLAEFRVGDVVAMFATKLTSDEDAWTYGAESIERILGDVLNVGLDELLNLAEGEVAFKNVLDFSYVTVADAGAAVNDVLGVLVVEGVVGENIRNAVDTAADIIVNNVMDKNSSIKDPAFNAIYVNTILTIADEMLVAFAANVAENNVYEAISGFVGDIIGEAQLLTIKPFAVTVNTVVDTVLGTKMRDFFLSSS
jgi:sorbitol-specific phosphotransferase system component IIA